MSINFYNYLAYVISRHSQISYSQSKLGRYSDAVYMSIESMSLLDYLILRNRTSYQLTDVISVKLTYTIINVAIRECSREQKQLTMIHSTPWGGGIEAQSRRERF